MLDARTHTHHLAYYGITLETGFREAFSDIWSNYGPSG
jgi:hypothetical protein